LSLEGVQGEESVGRKEEAAVERSAGAAIEEFARVGVSNPPTVTMLEKGAFQLLRECQ
jgi:hypothetical protein